LLLFWLHVAYWKWWALGVACFVSAVIPRAWGRCRNIDDAGTAELCPKCGGHNRVWPWSL